jgi:hypothetical protein
MLVADSILVFIGWLLRSERNKNSTRSKSADGQHHFLLDYQFL